MKIELTKDFTIHESMLKDFVEYVNKGWDKNYTVKDVVGVEWSKTYLFVYFKKEDCTADPYPIRFNLSFY